MKKLFILVGLLLAVPGTSLALISSDLQYGSRGSQVTELQEFLINHQYMAGEPTGNFYSLTLAGVKRFQVSQGIIPVTGYVGPKTRNAITGILAQDGITETQVIREDGEVIPSNSIILQGVSLDSLQAQLKALQNQLIALQKAQEEALKASGNIAVIPAPVNPSIAESQLPTSCILTATINSMQDITFSWTSQNIKSGTKGELFYELHKNGDALNSEIISSSLAPIEALNGSKNVQTSLAFSIVMGYQGFVDYKLAFNDGTICTTKTSVNNIIPSSLTVKTDSATPNTGNIKTNSTGYLASFRFTSNDTAKFGGGTITHLIIHDSTGSTLPNLAIWKGIELVGNAKPVASGDGYDYIFENPSSFFMGPNDGMTVRIYSDIPSDALGSTHTISVSGLKFAEGLPVQIKIDAIANTQTVVQ